MYSTSVSECFVPLMKVTAEIRRHEPRSAKASSAPSPFWTVITAVLGQCPESRSAAEPSSVVFTATITSPGSGRAASRQLAGVFLPEGVGQLLVREDLEVEQPFPTQGVEDRAEVDHTLSRKGAVVRVARRLAPVGEVDPVDALAVARDLLQRLAPEMPRVVHQPDVGAGIVDQPGRLVQ